MFKRKINIEFTKNKVDNLKENFSDVQSNCGLEKIKIEEIQFDKTYEENKIGSELQKLIKKIDKEDVEKEL